MIQLFWCIVAFVTAGTVGFYICGIVIAVALSPMLLAVKVPEGKAQSAAVTAAALFSGAVQFLMWLAWGAACAFLAHYWAGRLPHGWSWICFTLAFFESFSVIGMFVSAESESLNSTAKKIGVLAYTVTAIGAYLFVVTHIR